MNKSNKLPTGCNATSLNEKVGPWKEDELRVVIAQFRQGRDVEGEQGGDGKVDEGVGGPIF
jgi:hypothetical protein